MSLRNILSAAAQGASGSSSGLYVDDVFSTYLYTGNGSTQTVNNGIDLAGSGGLVWCKECTLSTAGHGLFDTSRGATKKLATQAASAQSTVSGVSAFNSSGFTLGADTDFNGSLNTYASWTLRKAPKFFDCGTYVGTGVTRTIAHSLGQAPGMIIIKQTSASSNWIVYHRQLTSAQYILQMNTTGFQSPQSSVFNSTAPTSTVFQLGTDLAVNDIGQSYVYYAFAHDSMADGIIQCGSFTTDGSGNATVTLGWEPQFLQAKASSTTGAWFMLDQMRGWNMSTDENLLANSSNAEITGTNYGNPTATGFYITNHTASATYVYLAIRRPNKPPTTGTQVYNAIARTGTGAAATVTGVGFAPDLVLGSGRSTGSHKVWIDRLRSPGNELLSNIVDAEYPAGTTEVTGFTQDGFGIANTTIGWLNTSSVTYINHFFKRAPGVMDIVCYIGTGSATTVAHNLGVAPELMIVKGRGNANNWEVYYGNPATAARIYLNTTTSGAHFSGLFNDTAPTPFVFTVGTSSSTNAAGLAFVAYLFATKAGISKVGSYTGNGSSQTIDCGFTTGARFILLKRTDAPQPWALYDSVRGIIAGLDPKLELNSTGAEDASYDVVDPHTQGFIVNQNTAGYNVSTATYIYLAFA